MICFKNTDANVLLAALEHWRIDCTAQRVKCGPGSDVLRGAFVEQEDAAARLLKETREQI